jgi:hypothetical protein
MRRYPIFALAGLVAAATLAAGPSSAAGQMKPRQNDQAQSARENCQAAPDRKKSDDKTGSITKKLDKCGGVLRPPDVNDPGLVKPAPDTGNMPVIRPGQVPDQAPKQE